MQNSVQENANLVIFHFRGAFVILLKSSSINFNLNNNKQDYIHGFVLSLCDIDWIFFIKTTTYYYKIEMKLHGLFWRFKKDEEGFLIK